MADELREGAPAAVQQLVDAKTAALRRQLKQAHELLTKLRAAAAAEQEPPTPGGGEEASQQQPASARPATSGAAAADAAGANSSWGSLFGVW